MELGVDDLAVRGIDPGEAGRAVVMEHPAPDDHARRLMGTGPIVVIPRRLTINQLHRRGVDTADTVVVEPVVAAVHPPTAHGVQALDVLAGAEGAVGGEG